MLLAGEAELALALGECTGLGPGQPEQHEAEVEPDRGSVCIALRERAEARERGGRLGLVEAADGCSDLRLRIAGIDSGGCVVLPLGRDATPEPLERDPVQELRVRVLLGRVLGQELELARRREPGEAGRRREARDEQRLAWWESRMQGIVRTLGRHGVRLGGRRSAPGRGRLSAVAGPEVRVAEVEQDERVLRVLLRESLERREA